MMKYIQRCLTFKGRADRIEFWIVNLTIAAIVLIPAYSVFEAYTPESKNYVNLSALLTLWPYLAVQVRRWHDRNKSSWWVLMNFVPVIGFFWVLIEVGFLKSVDEENRF